MSAAHKFSKKLQSPQSHICQIPIRLKIPYTNATRANSSRDQRAGSANQSSTGLLKFPASKRPGVRGDHCMLWSGLRHDRQSGLGPDRTAGLKVPYPDNSYS